MNKIIGGFFIGLVFSAILFNPEAFASHMSLSDQQQKRFENSHVRYQIVCVEGFKYLLVYKSKGVGVTQMFWRRSVGVYSASVPIRCDKADKVYK